MTIWWEIKAGAHAARGRNSLALCWLSHRCSPWKAVRFCLGTYKITDLCSYNVFNNACWLRYWAPSIRFDAANKRPFCWLFVGAIWLCASLLVMDLLGLWVNGSMQLYATCMHIVITRLCFKGSKGQSVEQTGAIVCDALTSDSTPQQPPIHHRFGII